MANRQEIEFVVRPGGAVEERVIGVAGADCETITAAIETALGEVTRREHTGDFYQQPDATGDSIPARA